ncbi:MAG: DivIVA domain-containing protein [Eubacterium sp.]|nr:DivIVA domain-containing protein [Eubacterium sp.]
MMQPVDVRSTNFGKGLFGYKKVDVDTYVETVYRSYDEAYNEVEKLREENARLSRVVEENSVKILELEKQLKDSAAAGQTSPRKEEAARAAVKDAKSVESEASKFFKQTEEEEAPVVVGDDDEVFVGEIEDNRKPNKVMIGDGEEEGADDFEFL